MKNKIYKNKEEQILNIAAEFSRAKTWLTKDDKDEALNCLDRSFELIEIVIKDVRNQRGLKEILRLREVLAEFYLKENKNTNEFIKIFRTLLNFNKFTSLVKI